MARGKPKQSPEKSGKSKKAARIVLSSFPAPAQPKQFKNDGDYCSDSRDERSTRTRLPAPGPLDPNKVLPELLGSGLQPGVRHEPLDRQPSGPAHRVIIGPDDDRRPVPNTRVPPYCAICSLDITFRAGASEIGTGWLVASRLVITAGHCVFNSRKGGFATEILVSPGRNGGAHWQAQTVTAAGGRFRTTPEHGNASEPNPEFDYGAIILPQPFHSTGNLGCSVYGDGQLRQETFNVVGYPFDMPTGTMWGHAQRLSLVHSRRLEYRIDTEGGQSGSPVFDKVQENGQTFYIAVGIHNAGSKPQQINIAARINDEVHARIERWIKLSENQ